jgi:glycosyltransferase involved in cell wall biosynthesis
MIIDWFSPLPPARSGISHYALSVISVLGQQASVRVWSDGPGVKGPFPGVANVIKYQCPNPRWSTLNEGDIAVYHIGNNAHFHAGIWDASLLHPGIVVMHDTCLQDFFYRLHLDRGDIPGWLAQNERHHGRSGRQMAERFLSGGESLTSLAKSYPLYGPALRNPLGIVVHTIPAFEEFRNLPYPLAYLPLPYPARGTELVHRERTPGQPCRLITFGHMGPNRGLETLVNALAGFPKRQVVVDIYGTITNDDEIRRLIAERDLENTICLHGYVPDQELEVALNSSDLAINLRYPTMGEASISQLRVWDHALPSLVTKTGWYESLPADTVAHVRPEHAVEDVRDHIRNYLSDPAPYISKGRNGRRWLEAQHSPERYAADLLSFASAVTGFRPALAAYALADRANQEIRRTFGSSFECAELGNSVCSQIAAIAGRS